MWQQTSQKLGCRVKSLSLTRRDPSIKRSTWWLKLHLPDVRFMPFALLLVYLVLEKVPERRLPVLSQAKKYGYCIGQLNTLANTNTHENIPSQKLS
jgi:hypothetical protein